MRSPALISIHPKTGCHAVLALLSECYPPPRGRSPTRYSPVCHFTQGRSPFHVRLACVRHAASVDSEPGSNSQVKAIATTVLPRPQRTSTLSSLLIGSLALLIYKFSRLPATPRRMPLTTRLILDRFVLARSIQFSKNRSSFAPFQALTAASAVIKRTHPEYRTIQTLSTPFFQRR